MLDNNYVQHSSLPTRKPMSAKLKSKSSRNFEQEVKTMATNKLATKAKDIFLFIAIVFLFYIMIPRRNLLNQTDTTATVTAAVVIQAKIGVAKIHEPPAFPPNRPY